MFRLKTERKQRQTDRTGTHGRTPRRLREKYRPRRTRGQSVPPQGAPNAQQNARQGNGYPPPPPNYGASGQYGYPPPPYGMNGYAPPPYGMNGYAPPPYGQGMQYGQYGYGAPPPNGQNSQYGYGAPPPNGQGNGYPPPNCGANGQYAPPPPQYAPPPQYVYPPQYAPPPQYVYPPQYAPPPQYVYPPQVQTPLSTLSILGFVFAFVMSLVGLILSIVAYSNAKREGDLRSKNFSQIGIILSAVFLGLSVVIGIIVGIAVSSAIAGGYGVYY